MQIETFILNSHILMVPNGLMSILILHYYTVLCCVEI